VNGQSGAEMSEQPPRLATVVDDIAIVKSMVTEAFNHAPARGARFSPLNVTMDSRATRDQNCLAADAGATLL
jgi:hypothetical protein